MSNDNENTSFPGAATAALGGAASVAAPFDEERISNASRPGSADLAAMAADLTAPAALDLFRWLWGDREGIVWLARDRAEGQRYRGCRTAAESGKVACYEETGRECWGHCDTTFHQHAFNWPEDAHKLAPLVEMEPRRDWWFTPAQYRPDDSRPKSKTDKTERHRRVALALPCPAAFSDLDKSNTWDDAHRERIQDFAARFRAAVVGSGSGNNLHVYLRLGRALDAHALAHLNRRIAKYLGGDMSKVDASSLLRIPGTRNLKPNGGPVVVKRLPALDSEPVSFEELDAFLPQMPAKEVTRYQIGELRECQYREGHPAVLRLFRNSLARIKANLVPGDDQGNGADDLLNREYFMMCRWMHGGELSAEYATPLMIDTAVEAGADPEHAEWKFVHAFDDAHDQPLNYDEWNQSRDRQARPRPALAVATPEPPATPAQVDHANGVEVPPADSDIDAADARADALPHIVQGYDWTQLGNAERLRDRHGHNMHHVPGWGWLTWDDRCWSPDAPRARRFMQSVIHEARAWLVAQDDAVRDKYEGWFTDMSKSAGISAALNEAAVFEGIDAKVAEFDADPYKLLVGNGVVNLRTGERLDYRREDRITKGTDVEYDPAAAHPRWTSFLDWAFKSDAAMIDYVQRMFGMCLVGNNSHQVAYFLYGPGRSGKTTLVNILSRLLGDYATVADLSVFGESAAGHNDALARLAGRRLVTFSETRAGQRINEAAFKRMTGGDELTASFKGKTGFSFRPMFTPVMFGNAQPSILFDSGVARRMKVIPMTASITDDKKDLELENKLMAEEGPAILAWAVRGAMNSWNSEVADPPTVEDAIKELRQDSDPLTQFIEECLTVDPKARVRPEEMWAQYRSWAFRGGAEFAKNKSELTKRLKVWGVEHDHPIGSRSSNNVRYTYGLRFTNPDAGPIVS
jgi:P4 family phage/plasmid primase-like protien